MTYPSRRALPRTACPTCSKHVHLSWREGQTVVGQHWPPGGATTSPWQVGPVGAPCEGSGIFITDEQIFDARRERHRTGALPVINLPVRSTSQPELRSQP